MCSCRSTLFGAQSRHREREGVGVNPKHVGAEFDGHHVVIGIGTVVAVFEEAETVLRHADRYPVRNSPIGHTGSDLVDRAGFVQMTWAKERFLKLFMLSCLVGTPTVAEPTSTPANGKKVFTTKQMAATLSTL